MKALSIKQPWAWLICAGVHIPNQPPKDVENRSWGMDAPFIPKDFMLPARVYIHAGAKFDNDALIDSRLSPWTPDCLVNDDTGLAIETLHDTWKSGAIIGEATLTKCAKDSKSPWANPGQNHFIITDPVLYDEPIPMRGQLGFFEVKL